MKTLVDLYVHGSREAAASKADQLKLTGEVARMFSHITSEHRLTYEVDLETGLGTVVAIDGRKVEPKQ